LEIIYFEKIESTQKYLLENLKENICIWSEYQTDGIGSRGNNWIGERGNLFFSFSIHKNSLAVDLKLQSISIYYMFLLKDILESYGSNIKFKWPNDLYLEKKVAGCLSNIKNDIIIVGIGLNTQKSENFDALDIAVTNKEVINQFLNRVEEKILWSQVYPKLEEEFNDRDFITSDNIELKRAKLNYDGSIKINNERIYSLR